MEDNEGRPRRRASVRPGGVGPKAEFAGRRILLVEGSVLIALCSQLTLRELGCVVVGPALRLRQAFTLARSEALDAAYVDADVDDVAGVALVAETLCQRGIPFVLATGARPDSLQAAFHGHRVVPKPYTEAQMEALVRGLLQGDLPGAEDAPARQEKAAE